MIKVSFVAVLVIDIDDCEPLATVALGELVFPESPVKLTANNVES